MITQSPLLRDRRWLLALLVLVPVLLLAAQGLTYRADAADLDWVDGGDDQLCLQDDTGVALSHPEIEQCSPIIGCETGETNGKAWIRFPNKNGVWQPRAEFKDYVVLYGDEPFPSSTPTPTPSASPTTKPTASPTTKPTKSATANPTKSSGASGGGTTTPVADDADDLGIDEDEEVAEGAPTAPAAPTVTVDGKDVTVTWTANADAELEGVTGYVLRFSGADPVETDATTLSHTFTDLADGNYRAAVRAVNEAGESPSSPPSDIATVGKPIEEIQGTLTVEGDLQPGATVTVNGAGYAKNVPELVLELHSTPVQVGTVATDDAGAFSTSVTIPADVEPGEHHLVVLYDGTEITSDAVQLVAAATEAVDETTTTDTASAPAETVPPQTGLVILVALALLGAGSLAWHVLTGRRRRTTRSAHHLHAPISPAPAGPATTVEVI